jgi:mannose-1-phosphate guanylyltransferase
MLTANYYGLILAGGRGTRFWPRSRRARAKQVLNFFGEQSLIQQTVDRLRPLLTPERIWVLTNDYLRDEIVKQLPDVPKRQILAEPAQRGTAPAIGLAAQIIHGIDPRAVMGVFPSDHVIQKPAQFLRLLKPAFKSAGEGNIVVLGIQPRWPETGYGYIEFEKNPDTGTNSPAPVRRFLEKPNLAAAKKFLKAGNFYWNSGMFFWKTSVLLDALRKHLPKTATLLASIPPVSSRKFASALAETFPHCENISIDYAVLEKAPKVTGIRAGDIGWNDAGSWNAVYELLPRDPWDNTGSGDMLMLDAHRNYVDGGKRTIALLGVSDLVIVDTPDALLIADRKRSQEVGDLVKLLEKQKREELL